MTDLLDESLYKISTEEQDTNDIVNSKVDKKNSKGAIKNASSTKIEKPIIVKLPKDRGITGLAIKQKQAIVATDGEYNPSFAPEIDNCIATQLVRDCMIGPCFD